MSVEVGKISSVSLRTLWKNESRDFTPWLADNIELLSDTLEIELEVEETEKSVGSFSVDILAKDINTDRYIVVENQLERTNHDHLGKLITYAAGLNAFAMVWIASDIAEEHQKAMDWLNEIVGEEFNLFALEIKLWKIGNSPPAPRFDIVSQPNEWYKTIQSNTKEITETKKLQKHFWEKLRDYMLEKGTSLSLRKPRPQHWYNIAVGRSGYHLSLTFNTRDNKVGCELYINDDEDGQKFNAIKKQKDKVEEKLSSKELKWLKLPNKKASRIIEYKKVDVKDEKNWDELFFWLHEKAERFHNVFSPIVKSI